MLWQAALEIPAYPLGQPLDRGVFNQKADRGVASQPSPDPCANCHGRKRIAAKFEKVLVCSDIGDAEGRRPDVGQLAFERIAWCVMAIVGLDS